MIYAATFGLAGPASAMVQCQSIVHTLLAAVFLKVYPTTLDCIGILCAILGAIVMTIDFREFGFLQSKKTRD